jgi:hypothetical protein
VRALFFCCALAMAGCFEPTEPICAYLCGPSMSCPTHYECRGDNYCHKVGTTGDCDFTDASAPDAAVGVPDASQPDALFDGALADDLSDASN